MTLLQTKLEVFPRNLIRIVVQYLLKYKTKFLKYKTKLSVLAMPSMPAFELFSERVNTFQPKSNFRFIGP